MKGYIVGSTLFIFLLLFLNQFINLQVIHHKQLQLGSIVEHHSQQARMAGYFTSDIKEEMLDDIQDKTKSTVDDIKMDLTETSVCTRSTFTPTNQINYQVQIAIRDVVAGASFLGISEEDNMYWYTLQGSVSSEKLCDS